MTLLVSRVEEPLPRIAYHDDPIIVSGVNCILELQPLLAELCKRCGQPGSWDDLKYFFSLPYARNKTPRLLLFVSRPGLSVSTLTASDLVAAVLTHEYRLWHLHTRIYATDDASGRRTLVAPASLRHDIAQAATRFLLENGADISLLSYQDDCGAVRRCNSDSVIDQNKQLLWATQQRKIFAALPLQNDFEATMGSLGKRTRSNMRYYRRKAERELGCVFIPNLTLFEEDFRSVNRTSAFPVSDEVASIRHKALGNSSNSFLAGLRDRHGQWLSIVGGQKSHCTVEIYWQMNLARLPVYSLSTVMRSFLIEYEISCGTRHLLIEGGTPHSMRFSFTRKNVTDIVVRRKSRYTALIARWANHALPEKNFLAQLLTNRELEWQSR